MQWLINKLASACENLGLTIILTKTNVSVQDVSKAPELQTRQPHFRCSRRIHLGSSISKNLSLDPEISRRSGKATCPIWLRKPGIKSTWLGTPKCTTTTHAFSPVWRVLRDGTRIARLDKKENLYRKRPEDMSEAQATFDVDFHGESGEGRMKVDYLCLWYDCFVQ